MGKRGAKNKKQKNIIVISSLCLLFCLCVGYAAFGTKISITAKGNVLCKWEDALTVLLEDLTVTGDGLYEDEYESDKYDYRGANPDNYITFNGETWRIISVDDNGIKIIWLGSDFLTSGSSLPSIGVGSSSWTGHYAYSYLEEYLSETVMTGADADKVISYNWSVGGATEGNNNLLEQINSENSETWTGSIGLITLSEYLRGNSDMENCGTYSLYNASVSTCTQTNWLYYIPDGFNNNFWTMTKVNSSETSGFLISGGTITTALSDSRYGFYPVIYLSADIKLTGEGTSADPYEIVEC